MGRKATRTEVKVYQVGSMTIKGVVFREVVGAALPLECSGCGEVLRHMRTM